LEGLLTTNTDERNDKFDWFINQSINTQFTVRLHEQNSIKD